MPANLPADPSPASEKPSVQGFQLDASAIGNAVRAVNLFRGDVNLPLTLVSLAGRNDLAIAVTAFYGSNVAQLAKTWNAVATTSTLGLGWSLPFSRIYVDDKTTGEATDGIYFIEWQGSVDRLIWCGEEGSEILFQARSHPLWQVRYDAVQQQWRVVMDNGNVALFGGTATGALTYGVRWDNWIGSTLVTSPAPRQYVVAWNLARLESPWGDGIDYTYLNDDRVVAGGVAYTRASYLQTMTDMLGQRVELFYDEKDSFEYVPPHTLPGGAPDPAYQDRYDTRFLRAIDVWLKGDADPHYSIELGHELHNVSGQSGDVFTKRFLVSIEQKTRDLRALPPMLFDYQLDATAPNAGALTRITFPEGGVVDYEYASIPLNGSLSGGTNDDIFRKNITVPNPFARSRPLVWHGPGYVAIAWYSENDAKTTLQVYAFGGRWSEPWSTTIAGRIDVANTRVAMSAQFFAVMFAPATATAPKLRIIQRNDYQFGRWTMTEYPITTSGTLTNAETALGSGNDFVVLHVGGDNKILRWTYDRNSAAWIQADHSPGTTKIALASAEDYYIAAYYSSSSRSATYQIFYRDVAARWQKSAVGAAGATFDWRSEYATGFWSLGANFAVGTYYPSSTGDPKLRIIMWDETYKTTGDQTKDGGSFGTQVVGSMIGSGRWLYRFDGKQWQSTSVAITDPNATRYAYGNDVAIISRLAGSGETSTLARYDADSAKWILSTIKGSNPQPARTMSERRLARIRRAMRRTRTAAAAVDQVYSPTAGFDFLTVGSVIYRRQPDETWIAIGTLPSNGNKTSLQNRAPSYLLYEDLQSDARKITTTVMLIENGVVAQSVPFAGERIVPTDDKTVAAMFAGARVFITYPAGEPIDAPSKLFLHRILNQSVSDQQNAKVTASVRIDPGYGATVTRYDYDAARAIFDSSGEVVQYPGVTEHWCDGDGNAIGGRTESEFANGLPIGDPAEDEYYSLLAGYLLSTRTFDADGNEVGMTTQAWQGTKILSGASSPLGVLIPAVQVTLAESVRQQSALALFPLPSDDASSFDQGVIPGGVRDTFAARGLPLSSGATVTPIVSSTAWRIDDGAKRYPIRRGDADLQVYASIALATSYTYASATAQKLTETTTDFDSTGVERRIESSFVYAWTVAAYAGLRDARMLDVTAEERSTNLSRNATVFARVQTFREWESLQAWAALAMWQWRGESEVAPQFDFASGAPNPDYLELETTLARNAQAQPVVTSRVLGPPASIIYDTSGFYPVATFANADVSARREAGYQGFESYEDAGGWTASSGSLASLITSTQAHTGVNSLQLLSTSAEVTNRFEIPASKGRGILSAWTRTEIGFSGDAGFTLDLSGGGQQQQKSLAITDTAGAWKQVWIYLDLASYGDSIVTVAVRLFNRGSAAVFVDDIRFGPLAGAVDVQVYDPNSFFVTATLGETGATYRMVNDPFGRLIGTLGPGDVVTALAQQWYSRDGHAQFDPADPNANTTLSTSGGGFLDEFRDGWRTRWTSPDPSQWSASGSLVHHGSAAGTISLIDSESWADYAVRLETDSEEVVQTATGLQIGNLLTIAWEPAGEWQMRDAGGTVVARFAEPSFLSGSWLVVAGRHNVVFFLNGQQILAHYFEEEISGAFTLFTATNGLTFEQVFVAQQPRLVMRYLDGNSRLRQEQALAPSGALVSGSLFDPVGRPAVTTKKMLYDAQPIGYRDAFVQSIDWRSGVLTGDLSSYYAGQDGRSNDEKYPYSRTLLSASPESAPVAMGAPGSTLAIRPGNARITTVAYALKTNDGFADDLPAGEYAVRRTTDAQGTAEITITDKLGNLVARRKVASDGTDLRTRFEYSARETLIATYPPNFFAPPPPAEGSAFIGRQQVDTLGRVIRTESIDAGVSEIVYDSAGRTRFLLTASGRGAGTGGKDVVQYQSYDVVARTSEQGSVETTWDRAALQALADGTWPANETDGWRYRFEYDGDAASINCVGQLFRTRLHRGADSELVTALAYDDFGRVSRSSEQGDEPAEIEYAHNVAGELMSTTYPREVGGLSRVTYAYDSLARLVAVGDDGTTDRFVSYDYAPAGNIRTEVLGARTPNPTTIRYRYNSPNWPVEAASDAFTETLDYWDQGGYEGAKYYNGQIARATSVVASADPYSWLLAYDGAGRLRTAQNSADEQWSLGTGKSPLLYDGNGNILSFADGTSVRKYAYDTGTNKLRAIDAGPEFEYDADGAVTQTGAEQSLTYDQISDDTATVTSANGVTLALAYAADGARFRRTIDTAGSRTARRYFSGAYGGPLVEEDTAGTNAGRRIAYVYGPTGIVALITPDFEASVIRDHVGSTRVVRAAGGDLIGLFNYRPFGDAMGTFGGSLPDLVRYLFTGREFDSESGLYNFNARLYDPRSFRFLRPDALAQFDSPYLFTGDDPMNQIDPTGDLAFLAALLIAALVGAAVGAVAGGAGYAIDVAVNDREFKVGEFFKAAGIGAAAGFVAGGVGFAAGAAVAAGAVALGVTSAVGGIAAGVVGGAIGGAAGGLAGQVITNVAMGNDPLQGWKGAVIGGAILGGITGGIGARFAGAGGPRGAAMTTRNLTRAAKGTVTKPGAETGYVRYRDLMKIVPEGTPNTWNPSANIRTGYKYEFLDTNNVRWTVRLHSADSGAPLGSASRSGWTAKIERSSNLLANRPSLVRREGGFITPFSNNNYNQQVYRLDRTHLPVSFF